MGLVLVLLLLMLLCGGAGLLVKGLSWLLLIALILAVVNVIMFLAGGNRT